MVIVNDRFSFEYGKYDWTLYEAYEGKDKDGEPKVQREETYHPTLKMVCNAIIEREAGRCESIEEIKALLEDARVIFADYAAGRDDCREEGSG